MLIFLLTNSQYLTLLLSRKYFPHLIITRKTELAARPTNAALMKQFCVPMFSIQGVMPYPMAKLIVFRMIITAVIPSPLTSR